MSFYINFRKEQEPQLRKVLRKSGAGWTGAELRHIFETDYHFDQADGSINAVSDYFMPDDAETLYSNLAEAGVVLSDESARVL